MTQKFFWLTSISIALLIIATVRLQTVNATDYHIGSGQQYATLEAFRLAREAQGASSGPRSHLMDGDRLILHNDDNSLTNQLYVGYDSSVTVLSSDPNQPRSISPANNARTRLFYLDGSGSNWSKIYFEGISNISGGYSSYDGGAIYAWWHNDIYSLDGQGVTFRNNFANGVGGAIYYWDALNCDLTDSNFIDNKATSFGGALFINASGTLVMSDTTNVTLGASEGKTSTFSGNRDQVSIDSSGNVISGSGYSNSIDFTGYSGNHVNLFIKTAENGILDMQDPFRTNESTSGSYTVNIEKTGPGTWKLGGDSIIKGSSGTTVSIKEGTLELYQGASIQPLGTNDEFNVAQNARVLVHGNNKIAGTRVLFQPGAFLTFDLSYYFPNSNPAPAENTPMLHLSGTTLQVNGTRIDIAGLPNDDRRHRDYVLIQGDSALTIGNFNLWIGNANIDVSGRISKRFGYSLGYGKDNQGKEIETQLVLSISETDNTILKWNNSSASGQWSVINKDWTLIRDNSIDSFVPGDTVQFFGSGNHTIELLETLAIGHNSVTDAAGKTWYGGNNDITGMHVSGDGNWTFNNGGSITDNVLTGKAALLFDGSGSLTLKNSTANTYSGGTNLSGTGTLNFLNGNLLGLGSINFLNNNTNNQASRLNATGTGTTTINQQIIAENGSNGLITVDSTKNLTFTRIADTNITDITGTENHAVYVKNGGKLTIQANSTGRYGNIIFSKNETKSNEPPLGKDSAVYVESGGTLNANNVTVSENKVQTGGGIVYNEGTTTIQSSTFSENIGSAIRASGNSQTTIFDSTFTKNSTSEKGAAVYYQGSTGNNSTLTIGATAGKTTLFSENKAGTGTDTTVANSVHLAADNNGTAILVIDTGKDEKTGNIGIVNMLDPLSSESDKYTINVTKSGGGIWKLAGVNKFEATGNTNFQITSGTVDLYKKDETNGIEAGNIEIAKGTFSIGATGTLNSRGGNSVIAPTITLANGATLGFDLTESVAVSGTEGSPVLLTLDANTQFGAQNINLLELSSRNNGYGLFNLLTTKNAINKNTVESMNLQYHGEDITQFRQQFGTLQTTNSGKTLQVEISTTNNGTTKWTNGNKNSQWDATSKNWDGQDELDGFKQFLHGDTVIFGDEGAGEIIIIDDGVDVAGITINNSKVKDNVNDYTFIGGSIKGNDKDSGLTKQGSGTVTFTQENTLKGRTKIEGGKIIANKISSLGTGNIVFENKGTVLEFNLNGESSGVFEQQISGGSGNGQLIKSGGGTLTLKNKSNETNTYGEGTIIRGGTLIADRLEVLGSGNIITGDENGSGTLVLNLTKDETFTKTISGTGSLKITGTQNGNENETKTLTLTQENSYSGGTTIDSNAAIFAQNIKSIGTGDIRNDGKLTLDLTSDGIFSQSMSGNGIFEKTGNGKLTLATENTFRGITIMNAGTLRLGNDLSLQNSLLNYRSGTLEYKHLSKLVLGGIAGTQNISLTNESEKPLDLTIGSSDLDSVYNGNITGTGKVTKIGSGTQTFSGNNSYSGGTEIEGGTIIAGKVSSFGTGNIKFKNKNTAIEFNLDEQNSGIFEQQISGCSKKNENSENNDQLSEDDQLIELIENGRLIKSGNGTLTLKNKNNEKNTYSEGTIIRGGTLIAEGLGVLGSGNIVTGDSKGSGTLVFNLEKNETFTETISGTGSVHKTGTGTLTLTKNLDISGSAHVLAGTMFVNSEAQSAITVYDGATLGGDGVVNNNVTFRKGSVQIIGQNENAKLTTFTAKNITYNNGSTVYIKVGMNGSDQVIAKDGFNFAKGGGAVNVVLLNLGLDDFDPETTISPSEYTVFVAENGKLQLNGEYIANTESNSDTLTVTKANGENVDGEIRFLAAPEEGIGVLGYSVKTNDRALRSITLNLAAVSPAAVAYLNTNQRSVLQGISDAAIFDGIYAYTKEKRGAVIDQTMPMIQTAMPFLTQRSVTQFNVSSFERLRFLREPLALTDREINAYRGSSHRFAHIHSRNNYLWFQNFGDFVRMSAKEGVPEFQANSYGFSVGVDRGINYHSSVGLGMGGYFSDLNVNDVYQKGDVGSYLISLYGNWINDENWMITGSTGFVFSSYELTRNAQTFNTTLNSQHSGTTLFASVEGSKKLLFGKYEVSPYLGADFIWLCEEGYGERVTSGLSSLALNVKSQDTFTVLSTVGIRLGRAMRLLGGNLVNPTLYAAWIHDWTESDIATTASFFGEPAFKIRGASMNRNRAQLGTNINMTLNKRTDMFARFNAELATRYSDLSFHLGIRFGF
ncbi:MAG: autotransporter domain-containing protein [Planctomycetaceae bacterium]|jgi:autotransporter-associated beta strand protein|nr:autotransporter domain-containing protein [Planctomycetaceae bacterium]